MTISLERLNKHFGHGEDPRSIGGIALVASTSEGLVCWKFDDRVATQTQVNPTTTTWSRDVARWKLSPAREPVPECDDDSPSVSVQAPGLDDDEQEDDPGDPEEADDLAQAIAELAPREDILEILELLSDEDNGDDNALQTLRRIVEQRSRFEVSLRRYNEFQFHIRSCLNMPTNLITVAGTDEVIDGLLKRLATESEPKPSEADAEAKQSAELAQATTEGMVNSMPSDDTTPAPEDKPSGKKSKR